MTGRLLIAVVVLGLLVGGAYVLRANTMSNEQADRVLGANLVVEFDVHTQRLPSHELPLVASSLFNSCRLQAEAGLAQPVTRIGENRFRAVLKPAPNETDRNQLDGCLSDVTVAHVRTGDVEMRTVATGAA